MSSAGVQSWTLTAADNASINSINIAENCPAANINNAIRQAMSSVMQELVYQGTDISASVSMSLAGVDWRFMAVTGSASIIHVGTGRAGLVRNVIWNSPSTIVNSANIICDGAASIVTSTYDMTMFTSLGSGAWRAVHFPVSAQTVGTSDIVDQAVTTAKIADVNVTTGKLADGSVTFAKMQAITDGRLLGASGGTAVEEISVGSGLQLSSNVLSATGSGTAVQMVKTETGAVSVVGAWSVSVADTIPSNSSGTGQVMTLAITPLNAANRLKIDVVVWGAADVTGPWVVGLFQDSNTSALAAGSSAPFGIASKYTCVTFTHHMAAGTTSPTTFKVWAGVSAANFTFNGQASGRIFGGVSASSITITEYT